MHSNYYFYNFQYLYPAFVFFSRIISCSAVSWVKVHYTVHTVQCTYIIYFSLFHKSWNFQSTSWPLACTVCAYSKIFTLFFTLLKYKCNACLYFLYFSYLTFLNYFYLITLCTLLFDLIFTGTVAWDFWNCFFSSNNSSWS